MTVLCEIATSLRSVVASPKGAAISHRLAEALFVRDRHVAALLAMTVLCEIATSLRSVVASRRAWQSRTVGRGVVRDRHVAALLAMTATVRDRHVAALLAMTGSFPRL
ncbi:MAG: hypothetical protein U5K38_13595 [Woeseiaceae bacterium]|nr:hypothetical protein [Woeseiaceae bacterium]